MASRARGAVRVFCLGLSIRRPRFSRRAYVSRAGVPASIPSKSLGHTGSPWILAKADAVSNKSNILYPLLKQYLGVIGKE